MNPFDETAVGEAVLVKEKDVATEIIAVSCGVPVPNCHKTLRTAMTFCVEQHPGLLIGRPVDHRARVDQRTLNSIEPR